MPQPSAIDLALSAVAAEVNHIITTVPGGYNMPMLAAARRAGLKLLVTRSELGAAWIALGLAWESERPSLVFVITSPGVYGTLQALHAASVNRVPLVLVSGEASLPGSVQSGTGFDGPSTTRVTAPLSAWSADVTRPGWLPVAFSRAVKTAMSLGQPVHLNVPVQVACAGVTS